MNSLRNELKAVLLPLVMFDYLLNITKQCHVIGICIFVVQAEKEHDRKVKKKEIAREQGEGTWMLQSVDERIKHEEEVRKEKYYCRYCSDVVHMQEKKRCIPVVVALQPVT